MKRRNFLKTSLPGALGLVTVPSTLHASEMKDRRNGFPRSAFTYDEQKITFYVEGLAAPVKIIQITDTHLWEDDDRGAPYRQYSDRMAKAYNRTKHYKTGEDTHPRACFEQTLQLAREKKADFLALTGDIFNFPSRVSIEWVMGKMAQTSIPYLFVAGNHDWHYEGMPGSSKQLRETWINERLKPLYQGNNPMMAAYEVKGITVLAIDNSTYEITPEQLAFFKRHTKGEKPLLLMIHIPLYAPGRSVGYGCGHPDWSAKNDKNYQLERREPWPENGHSAETNEFYDSVLSAPNLLGIFTGHVHRQTFDLLNEKPQFVCEANFKGAFFEIDLQPLSEADAEKMYPQIKGKKRIGAIKK